MRGNFIMCRWSYLRHATQRRLAASGMDALVAVFAKQQSIFIISTTAYRAEHALHRIDLLWRSKNGHQKTPDVSQTEKSSHFYATSSSCFASAAEDRPSFVPAVVVLFSGLASLAHIPLFPSFPCHSMDPIRGVANSIETLDLSYSHESR